MNSIAVTSIGHNNPPGMIDFARDSYRELVKFMADRPIIGKDDAKAATLLIERTRKLLADLDDERRAQVFPLNEKVKQINEQYRSPREIVSKVLDELCKRLTSFLEAEEARRAAEAEAKRCAAEEAERLAREAEQREREAKDDASQGLIGVNVGAVIAAADVAFDEWKKADRAAALAEHDIPARIGSQLGGRSLSLRGREILQLDDATAALAEIGVTEKIRDALLSGARDFKRLKGRLPNGISATTQRSI